MWLINTRTYTLEYVNDENEKAYAILSHRWEDGEVSFQDMQSPAVASKKKGYLKIINACKKAKGRGFEYIWVDTCCINKDSHAELSEAINSMYRWYQTSAVCFAFLSDVGAIAQMESSEWFTRGWTLQELIAPKQVVFYNRDWKYLCTRERSSTALSKWTGIDLGVLSGQKPLSSCSVAQRMSWASKRVTTRFEDRAYCLMGILTLTCRQSMVREKRPSFAYKRKFLSNLMTTASLRGKCMASTNLACWPTVRKPLNVVDISGSYLHAKAIHHTP